MFSDCLLQHHLDATYERSIKTRVLTILQAPHLAHNSYDSPS